MFMNWRGMKQALYRKYRSKSLDEVVGQEHITSTLKKALEEKSISHAYLFTGPKGVGKTSIARILAHAVNEIDYNDESIHLDIIEIDAASNRRIDEIRDLRDKVHISPTSSKYKVYIVDEVHMLTKEAFNALLKTLEEPPEHVIFILATTEYSKLPDTIVSRTQHFKFSPVSAQKVANHLLSIAESENISLDHDAALLIADYGEGSFRDSISLLDKLKTASESIDIDTVNQSLGRLSSHDISDLVDLVYLEDAKRILTYIDELKAKGVEIDVLINQINIELRQRIIKSSSPLYINLYRKLAEIKGRPNSELLLEIALVEQCLNSIDIDSGVNHEHQTKADQKSTDTVKPINRDSKKKETNDIKIVDTKKETEKPASNKTNKVTQEMKVDANIYESTLLIIKPKYNTLYSVLRMSEAKIENDNLILKFKFPFHYKKINTKENIKIISDAASEIAGKNIKVTCVLGEKSKKQEEDIVNVSNIFGGGEMLES